MVAAAAPSTQFLPTPLRNIVSSPRCDCSQETKECLHERSRIRIPSHVCFLRQLRCHIKEVFHYQETAHRNSKFISKPYLKHICTSSCSLNADLFPLSIDLHYLPRLVTLFLLASFPCFQPSLSSLPSCLPEPSPLSGKAKSTHPRNPKNLKLSFV